MTTDANLVVPTDDSDVVALEARGHAIVEAAAAMVVADDAGAQAAGAFLVETSGAVKSVEKRRKFFVEPLNAHVKAINDLFRRLSAPFAQADETVREKVLAYRREQEARAAAERWRLEAEERARREAAEAAQREAAEAVRAAEQAAREQAGHAAADRAAFEAHLTAERASEEAARASLVRQAVAAAPAAPKTVTTDSGGRMTARKRWTFEVVDPAAVPREYLFVNDQAIRHAVAEGVREIAGVRIYEHEVLAVSGAR